MIYLSYHILRYLPAGRQGPVVEILNRLMNKYFVYAIRSEIDGRIYVGMSLDPIKRLSEHNSGETSSTKHWKPWRIIYKKFIGSRIEARKEEKRLKSGFGKEFLKSLL